MHNKCLTISDTSATPVPEGLILQMTSNWTGPQLSSQFYNSAVQIWGDEALYAGYNAYFSILRRPTRSGPCAAAQHRCVVGAVAHDLGDSASDYLDRRVAAGQGSKRLVGGQQCAAKTFRQRQVERVVDRRVVPQLVRAA